MSSLSRQWKGLRSSRAILICFLGVASMVIIADGRLKQKEVLVENYKSEEEDESEFIRLLNLLWQKGGWGYTHVWPELTFGWHIVVGSIIGFFGAAFGSVGGVGGGGIFVPMFTLIIGFDAKSSTAISECMVTGVAASTVYYNLKLRHPTLDMPIIDYDLALLFQPVMILGISVGVMLNAILADWMITVLLIILFAASSTESFLKGVETWKKETIIKKEAARRLSSNGDGSEEVEYKPLPGDANNGTGSESKKEEVTVLENVQWKKLGLLFAVWLIILALEITKKYITTCSVAYWVCNLLQIPVALGVSSYQAVSLYKGWTKIESKGQAGANWKVHQLVLYCFIGMMAGVFGGLFGLGGGFIMGPLFLELGVPPQVSSATTTFVITFSASMSVIEYYLLKRFPVPYALYFVAVSMAAVFIGQYVVRKIISILRRASIIIFILAFTVFVSAISLGGVGITNVVEKIENHEYMGFDNICSYKTWP
ncbi:sulfite exporter TauE/SafE family protein 3-like [Euphorbia lathyris]|uniref:sulfite exporter TauE/SafE family protein 3-like n=1 Tax=Euphorbia lathyris TaxID=212925 RepID=UPI00331411A0